MKDDNTLKVALAKMLPELLKYAPHPDLPTVLSIKTTGWPYSREVLDTELLYLCSLIEKEIVDRDMQHRYLRYITHPATHPEEIYYDESFCFFTATWQVRVMALAKLKDIEV